MSVGAKRVYPAAQKFGPPPASNPDTALQADIVARVPYQPPDRANARAALDYLGNATSPHENFGVNNDYAWVGLTALAPSEVRKVPDPEPEEAAHQCSQPRHAARFGRAASQERTR